MIQIRILLEDFAIFINGYTSGTKRPRVIVIFEASDVTRVCPLDALISPNIFFLSLKPGIKVVRWHWGRGRHRVLRIPEPIVVVVLLALRLEEVCHGLYAAVLVFPVFLKRKIEK